MKTVKNDKIQLDDNHVDDHVDIEIQQCLSEDKPKNFFMFAGAGSGKTRSLVNTLLHLKSKRGQKLFEHGQQVAVITYTNAACDVITKRLQYNQIFAVSTIHSFLWELIKPHQADIKAWVEKSLQKKIMELREKKTRTDDSEAKRIKGIKDKSERLAKLTTVNRFSYNPNGNNAGYDSLSHDEVIKMGSEFILTEETMQEILMGKYPILLIDESQDTKKELIDALLLICEKFEDRFIVGMFGDTMQKIYLDGKENLSNCIPDNWAKPVKVMNHRSAKRIVDLANTIRGTIDKQAQQARSDAEEGIVRLFIVPSTADKKDTEAKVAETMANDAENNEWLDESKYKNLILEHHMAANRFNFENLYAPLNESKLFDTSLRDGSIFELKLLSEIVSPLVQACRDGNSFMVSKIVRKHSPLLDKKAFANTSDQINLLERSELAVDELVKLWGNDMIPSCIEVFNSIRKTGLFELNDRTHSILDNSSKIVDDKKVMTLRTALSASFDELERYYAYVTGNTQFDTHQGVKGLEFPHVMVIMDDAEMRGRNLFSYEKLFGAKEKSDQDKKNEKDGKDNAIARTTRLFYVACTRAEKSLAVVAYSENVAAVRETAISSGWFTEEEIHIL